MLVVGRRQDRVIREVVVGTVDSLPTRRPEYPGVVPAWARPRPGHRRS